MREERIPLEDYLFGRVAVALGFVTPEELRASLRRLKGGEGGSLCEIMCARGLLGKEEAETAQHVQWRRRCKHLRSGSRCEEERELGRTLLEAGSIGLDELETALLEQERLARRHVQVHLGEVLVNRGLVQDEEVRRILRSGRGEVRRCRSCDRTVRIGLEVPEERWVCPQCGGALDQVSYLQQFEAEIELV